MYATSCSPVGPGRTLTSSYPSWPQLSKICFVACESSGTVTYSHFCMGSAYGADRDLGERSESERGSATHEWDAGGRGDAGHPHGRFGGTYARVAFARGATQ